MLNLNGVSIRTRLISGFSLIGLLAAILGGYAIWETMEVVNTLDKLYMHPFAVSNAVRDIKIHINAMHRSMKDVALARNTEDIEEATIRVGVDEREVFQLFELVEERFLGDKKIVSDAYDAFVDWRVIRAKVIRQSKAGNHDEAAAITKGEGAAHVELMNDRIGEMVDFAAKKGEEFHQRADDAQYRAEKYLIIMLLIVLVTCIVAAAMITQSIVRPLNKVMEATTGISNGVLDNELDVSLGDELGDLNRTFVEMQDNLRHKSDIAQRIAQGDLSQRVEARTIRDVLANSINEIIDSFGRVVHQANAIAAGDYRMDIVSHSDQGELGRAIGSMTSSLKDVVGISRQIADGDFTVTLEPKSENDELAVSLNDMTRYLKELSVGREQQNWLKSGQAELSSQLQGLKAIDLLARDTIHFLCNYLNAQLGCIYILDEAGYRLTASHAMTERPGMQQVWKLGEGLVGQAALKRQCIQLRDLPDDYYVIASGSGEARPTHVLLVPCIISDEVKVVLEFGSFNEFSRHEQEFLQSISDGIAIAIASAESRQRTAELLEQTRAQSRELQDQQRELESSNVELEMQAKRLRQSEEELKEQQEELMATNEELEEKTRSLEEQRELITQSNVELEEAREVLERKAEELELSSRYKSEFLANMSHELRTPLNSLLILAQDLADNRKGNLSTQQVESSKIICRSGNDLLKLINEILDLSKIEAGKMDLHIEDVDFTDLLQGVTSNFKRLAEEKDIQLSVHLDESISPTIRSDRQRLDQVIRNLVSNAIKFTDEGMVACTISSATHTPELIALGLEPEECVTISVRDTGIGVPEDKHREIFEAFHQVDGSISRKYGGTGLGLSIVREMVQLLGGALRMESKFGEGSLFEVILPISYHGGGVSEAGAPAIMDNKRMTSVRKHSGSSAYAESIPDDRNDLGDDDRIILAIEDDCNFARVLRDFCHERGLKFLHAGCGAQGIDLTVQYHPSAIILDIKLPGMDGWSVLEQLKANTATRHVPIHMMSANEETIDAYRRGVVGYLTKPIDRDKLFGAFQDMELLIERDVKELLVVEDNEGMRHSIRQLICDEGVHVTEVATGDEALAHIESEACDCIILDLGLPDMTGFELLQKIEQSKKILRVPPVIVYTGQEITSEEQMELEKHASSIIVKGVKSQERLLDETALFLHRVVDEMPELQRRMIAKLHDRDALLEGKKILLVDDDMRNVFAIAKVLEDNQMTVIKAANGQKALDSLEMTPDIDMVLMDLMMPVMDGLEATRRIREQKKFQSLPIIAVTAKAMKEDQEKCFEAGCNDYLAKPVNIDRLLSLMRLWLYR